MEQIIQRLLDTFGNEVDFATLLELEARDAGLELEPENIAVDDGLSPVDAEPQASGLAGVRRA